ncbi:MAG: lysylphosphatidylglycerol synthase transmembrane domain-containing protein [Gemmatimonadota bacterium]
MRGLLGLAVSVALLWWVLHDVSLVEVWGEIRRADPWLLGASVVVATAGFAVRAARWRVLLLPNAPGVPFRPRFAAVCIGFMTNNVLPARLGEFARAYSLSKISDVGMSESFASLVVERVFDGLVVAFFLFLSISVPGFVSGGIEAGSTIRDLTAVGAGLFGAALLFLWLMVRFPDRTLGLFEATLGRILPPQLTDRGVEVLSSFIDGLGALHDPVLFARALAWSFAVWLWLSASIWLGLLAFDITAPGFTGAVFVQSLIAFAVALPSSPGFFGPFEAATKLALGLYGVASAQVIAFATGYHILTFIPVSLMGAWYVRVLGIRWSEVEQSEQIVESAVEEGDGDGGGPAAGG